MTRTVVNSQEVAHLWAHQSQDHAHNSGESVFFNGDTIYSYGYHFPMARIIDGAVLVTSRSYSVTTSKHQGYVWHACNHMECFSVDNVEANTKPEHKKNLEIMRAEYEAEILTASRARTYGEQHLWTAENIRISANQYSAMFKLRVRVKPADVESIKARAALQAKKAKAAQRKAQAVQLIKFNEHLSDWRAGSLETYRLPGAHLFPAVLRISGDNIETSQGANFPIVDALQAIPLVMRCKARGEEWKRNGEQIKLGYYRLDHISKTGTVKAGCHTVEFSEVVKLAKLLKEV